MVHKKHQESPRFCGAGITQWDSWRIWDAQEITTPCKRQDLFRFQEGDDATLVLSKNFINLLHKKKKLQGERDIRVDWVLRKRPEGEAGTELGFAS